VAPRRPRLCICRSSRGLTASALEVLISKVCGVAASAPSLGICDSSRVLTASALEVLISKVVRGGA
jgi:hypothetical protein